MSEDKAVFKCGIHDFSTTDLTKYDKHCAEVQHEYDLHIDCANGCGHILHIKPNQKLSVDSQRIPRGYLCNECLPKVKNVPEIKEAGEVQS